MSGKNNSKSNSRSISLPVTRVRMIMKSSPDVATVSSEALHVMTVATELFIEYLATIALQRNKAKKEMDYNDLATVVDRRPSLSFLQDIIPNKVKAKDFLKILRNEVTITDDDYM